MRDDLLGDVELASEDGQFYIFVNGVKIAKRENRRWTTLVPGFSVEDLDGGTRFAIDVDYSVRMDFRKWPAACASCSVP